MLCFDKLSGENNNYKNTFKIFLFCISLSYLKIARSLRNDSKNITLFTLVKDDRIGCLQLIKKVFANSPTGENVFLIS